jgi:hypothetical protein
MKVTRNPLAYRGLTYLIVAMIVFVLPTTYLPFRKPQILHDIFGTVFSILAGVLLAACFACIVIYLATRFLFFRIRRKESRINLLIEILLIFVIVSSSYILYKITVLWPFAETTYSLNKKVPPEEFINPFLAVRMLDCREDSSDLGIIFLERNFSIEHNYLAFAPDRVDKKSSYPSGKEFEDDWYFKNTGSQWGQSLKDCNRRNKLPY